MADTGFDLTRRSDIPAAEQRTKLRVLFAIAAVPAAAIALLLPKTIAMPVASLVSIALAFAVAIYAYRSRVNYRSRGITFWDLAGMLALIGFGAGALSDESAVLQLFGLATER